MRGAAVPAQEAGETARADPLAPDRVLAVPNGPALVLEEAPGLPVAGIRVSAPLDLHRVDDARALVELAVGRARPLAELIGASLRGGVADGRIWYQVIGDRRDMDELAWIARILAGRPTRQGSRAVLARQRARDDRLAETPHGRVVAAIGGSGAGEGAAFARIERLWARTHARNRLRVFVLGAAAVPVALADLSFLGADAAGGWQGGRPEAAGREGGSEPSWTDASRRAGEPRDASGAAAPPTPAWAAAFFSLGLPHDPGALVARQALAAGLRDLRLPRVVLRVQHGLGADGRWTALTATARAQRDADAALAAALALLSEEELAARWSAAAEAARNDLAATAATPAGWLSLADRWHGRAGDVRGALARVGAAGSRERSAAVQAFESTLSRMGAGW